LPIRDEFDSSFDEVIYVDYQTLQSSQRLLSRRVLNLPHPFMCFCHVMAGGLPRDLIRVCRALFEARELTGKNGIRDTCAHVVYGEVTGKLRAMTVAAERRPTVSKEFLQLFLTPPPATVEDLWKMISALELAQSLAGETDEDRRVAALPTEALLFLYFAVTILDIFENMDESRWMKGEDDGVFDTLAAARRSLSQHPPLAAERIAVIRNSFGLAARAH
jgi:hypothetical protein